MLTRIALSHKAHRQIRRELAENMRYERLLGAMLSRLSLERGKAWALVPPSEVDVAETDFDDGIFSPEDEEALYEELGEWVSSKLRRDTGRFPVLVFEYWTDAEDDNGASRTFRVDRSLFDYADRDASSSTVARLLGASLWFPTVGLIGQLPHELAGIDRAETDSSTVEHLVDTVQAVLVGAWHAEGYIVWEPDPTHRHGR